eukprot:TRINITY_DN73112_c0_g1_i1.p1 TRINITY_DN73112_c0_g1~~TRINITY_DN73112_c0_g1_i1.p1  ORF type:complete len:416 (-),score=89.96 TRINITY_DN73112_c0_g1_i1:99-1346(-)
MWQRAGLLVCVAASTFFVARAAGAENDAYVDGTLPEVMVDQGSQPDRNRFSAERAASELETDVSREEMMEALREAEKNPALTFSVEDGDFGVLEPLEMSSDDSADSATEGDRSNFVSPVVSDELIQVDNVQNTFEWYDEVMKKRATLKEDRELALKSAEYIDLMENEERRAKFHDQDTKRLKLALQMNKVIELVTKTLESSGEDTEAKGDAESGDDAAPAAGGAGGAEPSPSGLLQSKQRRSFADADASDDWAQVGLPRFDAPTTPTSGISATRGVIRNPREFLWSEAAGPQLPMSFLEVARERNHRGKKRLHRGKMRHRHRHRRHARRAGASQKAAKTVRPVMLLEMAHLSNRHDGQARQRKHGRGVARRAPDGAARGGAALTQMQLSGHDHSDAVLQHAGAFLAATRPVDGHV